MYNGYTQELSKFQIFYVSILRYVLDYFNMKRIMRFLHGSCCEPRTLLRRETILELACTRSNCFLNRKYRSSVLLTNIE
jgi:hypothetical protein